MLQKIRDRATGPLAWFIVGIICIPFAFFGIEAFRSDGSAGDVAKVGDEIITDGQLQQEYQQRYQQLQQMLGESFRPDMINPDMLRRSVLDGLVQDAVNRQYMAEERYRVSDQKLMDFIRAQEAFHDNGQFSSARYREQLSRQGMSPVLYEDRVRAYLTDLQLRQAVTGSAVLAEPELQRAYAREKQQRRFAWRRYDSDKIAEGITIGDEAIAARYEERKASLQAPERVRVRYLELSRADLKDAVELDEAALQALYEAEKNSRFAEPEERQARHILIRASADDARTKIEELAQQLAEGADFAALASEHSQDPGSQAKGGDLGWVSRGMMVAPFEEALFGLEVGQVSDPVETSFGWHLIKLTDLREPRVRPFEDEATRREVEDLYRERQARERFSVLSEQLEQISFENPTSLEPAASALALEIKESAWFTRDGGAGIAAEDAVIKAAFSDLVLNGGENSQPITLGARQIVLRQLEHEPARQQTLEEVRESLREELLAEAVAAEVERLAKADLARLEGGEVKLAELEETAVAANQAQELVQRGENKPERALVATAFSLDAPAEGAASYAWVKLPASGDGAVIELTEVIDADWAQASEADKEQLRRRLLDRHASQEFAAMQAALRESAKVRILRDTF